MLMGLMYMDHKPETVDMLEGLMCMGPQTRDCGHVGGPNVHGLTRDCGHVGGPNVHGTTNQRPWTCWRA